MIKTKYYYNKGETIYECDRCHTECERKDTYRISIHNQAQGGKTLKSIHLCKHCTQVILSIVKKGKK